MEKLRARFGVSFSTKVLVPVVTIMILLMAITVWMVNQRITQQFQADARRNLSTADKEFQSSQKTRTKYLVQRFSNLRNEPRYRAVFQSGDVPTIIDAIKELPSEQGVDIALFTSDKGKALVTVKRDPVMPLADFESSSLAAVRLALQGEATVDTIRAGEKLFDVVSIPVAGRDGVAIGALTFGSEIGTANIQEFNSLTLSHIVLLANGRVVASTVPKLELDDQFARLFNEYSANPAAIRPARGIKDILLDNEHYFWSAGKFPSLTGDTKLGYLLLSSYEQPLRALQNTQQMLLLVSSMGILLGTVIIWWLVRKITQPLRELGASAEAVGKGDFSRRVEVTSRDECGELAAVFNQMTENVKRSREQLESTVETLKTTQAQLIQSEKLSGIGEFVAGVAHELNNPLTSVMGFSELLAKADTNPQHKRYLEMIHKSSLRCQKIVQSLLSFARRHKPERKLSCVNELVTNAVEFLNYQLRTSNIEVITNLAADLPRTMVDPHQVQQVFLNLVNNARQAIEAHQPKGVVRITTETCGQNARIIFQDDGPGISESNLSKVFDPFFTTKEVGKGTGLGLSLCYGIIKDHGGSITVRSKPGEGASFVIELPLATEVDEPSVPAAAEPLVSAQTSGLKGVGKKVLVIDDEDSILQMVRDTLSEDGYQVDIARDGEAGLKCLKQVPYDLTLCDWKMPGLNGEQVYERLLATNPALSERMIFITGDIINDKAQKFLGERRKVCLSKPFSLVEFRAAIGKALATA